MIATLGSWEIGTNPSKRLGYDAVRICLSEAAPGDLSPSALELEQAAAEFIARQVLERDSVFFEG